MRKCIIAICLFGCYNTQAQTTDSLTVKTVYPPIDKTHKSDRYPQISRPNHKIYSLILPATAIGYGFISLGNNGLRKLNENTKAEITETRSKPVTKIDNYLQYSPAVAVYALNAIGIKGKNNFRDRTIIYALSTGISTAIVIPLKSITKEQRPDGSNFKSFPSGHTATAFAAAEFMRQEYKDASPWYGVLGYGAAAATGILRLYNNKHWVGDVIAGAGFGVLSTKLAYWIYPAIKHKFFKNKSSQTMLMPYYQNRGGGISLVYNFRN